MLRPNKIILALTIYLLSLILNVPACLAIDLGKYFPDLHPDADGRIETLNNKGGMAPIATGSERWLLADLKHQNTEKLRILEVGPAFGRMAVELFKQNFQGSYTAIELSSEHLQHLKIALSHFPTAEQNVTLIAGEFPFDTNNLSSGSFDIILATHVFHFFNNTQLDSVMQEIKRLLAPGGKTYVTVKTPYSQRYCSFIPTYLERKRINHDNPGYMASLGPWIDPSSQSVERLQKLQGRHMYVFSKDDLQNIFVKHQFQVKRCEEMSLGYKSATWQAPEEYADREDAGILAIKPRS